MADHVIPLLRIEPSRGWARPALNELFAHSELIYFLIWRDIKVRYKQTVLGMAWAIIQPFATMIIFSVFFGRLAKMPSDGIPYPLFAYTALVPWTFFAAGLNQSCESLVGNANLIKKVYFPRLAIPLAAVLSGAADLLLAMLVLLGMAVHYGVVPQARALWCPVFLLLACVTSLGSGLWLSALNVRFRDVRHAMPFLIQVWMFATPIAYPSSLLHQPWRTIYGLNPMAGAVEGLRWTLLGTTGLPVGLVAVSVITAAVVLVSGVFYFRRMERTFADVV